MGVKIELKNLKRIQGDKALLKRQPKSKQGSLQILDKE